MARADQALLDTRRAPTKLYPRERYILARANLFEQSQRYGWSWGFLHRKLFELHKAGFRMQRRLGNPGKWVMSWNRQLDSLLRVMSPAQVPDIMYMQATGRQRRIAAARRRRRRRA